MRSEILGSSLRLRAYRADDVHALYEAVLESIPEVAPFETWCHLGYTREEAEQYVAWWAKARERRIAFYYAIEDAVSGRFLGSCGVSNYSSEHRRAMLGYWVRTSATRRGVATAAARLVVAAAFEDLDLLRVSIGVPVANVASHRVVAKLGAVREGVLRQELVLPSGPCDVVLYSLLPGELREIQP
jgi:RimJ/RimL family protein N-acetyltransferase